jgi:signal transduction histidine kinase
MYDESGDQDRSAKPNAGTASASADRLLGWLCHEMRTPLATILTWSELLRTGKLNAQQISQGVEAIARSATLQTKLLNDVAEFRPMVADTVRLEPTSTDLHQAVRSAVDLIRPLAEEHDVGLVVTLDSSERAIRTDGTRLTKAIAYLLSSAIQSRPAPARIQVALAWTHNSAEISATLEAADAQLNHESTFVIRLPVTSAVSDGKMGPPALAARASTSALIR